jgi:5-methylcytosine-specific restriction endonuclease McrA
MVPGPDAILDEIGHAAAAMIAGDRAAADRAIDRIAHEPQQLERRRKLPQALVASVLWRDRSRCRYCARACLPPSVLRLVSAIWPDSFPYHLHWKANRTHVAYWQVAASIDHIHAGTMGGDWLDPTNLTTACWPCQQIKGNISLERLGWKLREIDTKSGWDGLISRYEEFWRAGGSPEPEVHRSWIKDFDAARKVGPMAGT